MSEVCKVCGICGGTHACNPTDINMNYMRKTIESQTATIKSLRQQLSRETSRANAWVDVVRLEARALGLSDDDSNGSIKDWEFIRQKLANFIADKIQTPN